MSVAETVPSVDVSFHSSACTSTRCEPAPESQMEAFQPLAAAYSLPLTTRL